MTDLSWAERQKPFFRARRIGRTIPLKSACERCGAVENLDRHHPDYSKPLEVITLCRSCHITEHLRLKPAKKSSIGINLVCPNCHVEGESNFCKCGFKKIYQKRLQQFQCKCCGKVFYK